MMERNQLDLIYILDRQGIMIIGIRSWSGNPLCCGFSLPAALGNRSNQPGGNHGRAVLPDGKRMKNYRRELDCFLESQEWSSTPFWKSATEIHHKDDKGRTAGHIFPCLRCREYVKRGELAVLMWLTSGWPCISRLFITGMKWLTKEMDAFIRITANHSRNRVNMRR